MLRTRNCTDCNLKLSQLLFYENGTVYDQLLILNSNYEVDPTLLAEQGLPYYAGTWVVYLLCANMALAATFTHLLLWNREDLRSAWSWMTPTNLRKQWRDFRWQNLNWRFWMDDGMRKLPRGDEDVDPHYAQMLKVSVGLSMIPIANIERLHIPVPRRPEQLVLCYLPSIVCGGSGRHLHEQFHFTMVELRHIRAPGDHIHRLLWSITRHYGHLSFYP